MSNELDQWDSIDAPASDVTLEQMDAMITKLRELRDDYDGKKEKATEAHNLYEAQEKLVMDTLRTAKRSKYNVEGVANVWIVEKEVYTTPKGNGEKTALFNYIKHKYGNDALIAMVSINFQTLNSWANKESESGVMSIPGLDAPTTAETLSMRRK